MRIAELKIADLIAGGLTVAIGVLAVWEGSEYPLGALNRMGPGYFPILLGILLIALGAAIPIEERRGVLYPGGRPPLRPILPVLAGIAAFGVLVQSAGLVPAVFALVLISALAEPRLRLGQTLVLAATLSVLTMVIFIEGLGLALRPVAGW